MDSAITALMGAGADAMDNIFDVLITLPGAAQYPKSDGNGDESSEDGTTKLRLRCNAFTPPHFSLRTYDVRYKTIKFKRPASVVEGDRVFDLSFRVDANYNTYIALTRWRNLLMNAPMGYAGNSIGNGDDTKIDDYTGNIKVMALASPVPASEKWEAVKGITDSNYTGSQTGSYEIVQWTFYNAWLMDLTDPSFKHDGGNPISMTAKFAFAEFDDPFMTRYKSTAVATSAGTAGTIPAQ